MKQSTLALSLKLILAGLLVCGVVVYAYIVPEIGRVILDQYPEFGGWYAPWLAFVSGTALPCAVGFAFAWMVAVNIGRDRSFSVSNARYLKYIAIAAAVDGVYFFAGNVVFLILGKSHPSIVLASMFAVFAAAAVAVAASVLSHLVYKAAALEEESELTI